MILYILCMSVSLPQFLMDGIINIIFLEVGILGFIIGMLISIVHHYSHNIRIGEGRRHLGHNHGLTDIAVCCAEIPFKFLHCPRKLVRGSWQDIRNVDFQVTELTLEVGIGFRLLNLYCLALHLLDPVPFWLGVMSIAFLS